MCNLTPLLLPSSRNEDSLLDGISVRWTKLHLPWHELISDVHQSCSAKQLAHILLFESVCADAVLEVVMMPSTVELVLRREVNDEQNPTRSESFYESLNGKRMRWEVVETEADGCQVKVTYSSKFGYCVGILVVDVVTSRCRKQISNECCWQERLPVLVEYIISTQHIPILVNHGRRHVYANGLLDIR